MEIRKLKASDYDELLSLLNTAFQRNDFDRLLPKMWQRDDEYMGKHFGLFEDSKLLATVGIYPFNVHIGDKVLKFATTGNVATLPQYEGKGYFSKLFPLAIEEARKQGAVSARLGGARQRYGRYGFEPCGPAYEFRITDHNAKYTRAAEGIVLEEIKREDEEALAFCNALMKKKLFYVERSTEEGQRDVYLALCSKEAKPFLVKRNGAPIGYISAKGNFSAIFEFSMEDEADILAASAAAALQNTNKMTSVIVPPTMPKAIAILQAAAQEISLCHPSRFCILQYERLVNRLLKVKESLLPLPSCDLVLKIEGGECLHLHTGADGAYCKSTDKAPDLTLPHLEAQRFLFGMRADDLLAPLPAEKQFALRNILPLPLTWATNDYV